MKYRVLGVLVLGVLIAVPSVASADRQSDILQEIAQIFEQIKQLQAQIDSLATNTNTTPTNTTPSVTTPPASNASCPTISRTLGVGSEGSDVTALQNYLASDSTVYPEGIVSGYFGSLTERALQRWQEKHGIVSSGTPATTGYGLVGPQTRRALKGCGNAVSSQYGGLLRVAPVSGFSPLKVTATATVNTANSCERGVYEIDFGDGTVRSQIVVSVNTCREITRSIPHTYNAPGTYSLSLIIGSQRTTLPITVRDRAEFNIGTDVVTPGSGPAPLLVQAQTIFTAQSCDSPAHQFQTFRMDFGDGTSQDLYVHNGSVVPSDCGRTITKSVPHTYLAEGMYTITLEEIGPDYTGASSIVNTTQVGIVNVGDVGTGIVIETLSVLPSSGTAPLSVSANFSHGLCREAESWRLDWGDGIRHEETLIRADGSSVSCSAVSASRTFTHIFAQAGTYNVRLYKGGGPVNTAPLAATKTIVVTQ